MNLIKKRIPWNKGIHTGIIPKTAYKKGNIPWSKLNTDKMVAWNKGLRLPSQSGENHPLWKGDNVSYRSLHKWVERHIGKANKCMNDIEHKSTRYHWANISKEYKRDLSDWKMLCPSCNHKDIIGRRVSP